MMEKKGNEIHLTSKAKQLLELVPEDLKKPELTADWEKKLSDIAKGSLRQDAFLREIREYTCEIVDEIKTGSGTFRHDNITNKICPDCGRRLLAVNGKNSKMLVCQDRECGYRETVSRTTNARCPKCHKRMEMIVKGKEETFVCACGYKEKLSSFQARRKKEGAGVNKRDVQKYLRQQQKEAQEPVNNVFAQALAGLSWINMNYKGLHKAALDFILPDGSAISIFKPDSKDHTANGPVGKHTDPYSHRSHVEYAGQYHCQSNTAQPHGKHRNGHTEFYVSGSAESVGRNKGHYPYKWLYNRDPGYHEDTHFCTDRLHASEMGDWADQSIHYKTGSSHNDF